MNKETILITGGAGYIGAHAVVAFEEAGFDTIILDNLSNSDEDSLRGIKKILKEGKKKDYYQKFFNCDLKNFSKLEKIFSEQKKKGKDITGVLHFAGLKIVSESCKNPLSYFKNNISGSINLFSCMEKFGCKKIIFSSSAVVYNSENKSPINEKDSVGEITNPYGTSKFLLEKILEDLSKFSGFEVANLRYFNPIGAHKSGLIGENPKGIPNNILPFLMKVGKGEMDKITVFGNDFETKDGTGERDYIDINDLIQGHLKAFENLKSGFETYNLGTGKPTSVLEIIKITEKVIGKKINYEIGERREGDVAVSFCENKKAKKVLGWEAKVSIEKALESSWKFYNK